MKQALLLLCISTITFVTPSPHSSRQLGFSESESPWTSTQTKIQQLPSSAKLFEDLKGETASQIFGRSVDEINQIEQSPVSLCKRTNRENIAKTSTCFKTLCNTKGNLIGDMGECEKHMDDIRFDEIILSLNEDELKGFENEYKESIKRKEENKKKLEELNMGMGLCSLVFKKSKFSALFSGGNCASCTCGETVDDLRCNFLECTDDFIIA